MADFDAALNSILADPRDRDRWLVLADLLDEAGHALGGRLRWWLGPGPGEEGRPEWQGEPRWQEWRRTPRVLCDLVLADPDFGPRAGVLRDGLDQADRIGHALRGR